MVFPYGNVVVYRAFVLIIDAYCIANTLDRIRWPKTNSLSFLSSGSMSIQNATFAGRILAQTIKSAADNQMSSMHLSPNNCREIFVSKPCLNVIGQQYHWDALLKIMMLKQCIM